MRFVILLMLAAALPMAGQPAPSSQPKAAKSKRKHRSKPRVQSATAPAPAQSATGPTSAQSATARTPQLAAAKKTARKLPRKPPPVEADIPLVVDASSVWRGCLSGQDVSKLASGFHLEQSALTKLLDDNGIAAAEGAGCTPYVAATGGEDGVASAVFLLGGAGADSRLITLRKTGESIIVTPGVCNNCGDAARREVNLPAREFAAWLDSESTSIAPNLRWQLGIVVPHMLEAARAKAPAEIETTAPPAADGGIEGGNSAGESIAPVLHVGTLAVDDDTVRVVVEQGTDGAERLISAEILEPGSGKRIDGNWWLDRPDGAGVIIGTDGLVYERALWESPVIYSRSARGVGPSTTTYRQKVPPKKAGAKATVKTVKVPSYHLGIDMTAPKGTDVHAVGDAKVVVAGRRRGFGNVIILDHGQGYTTYYAHLSKIMKGIKPGARVECGDVIGLVGSTGRSTAPHLHFETRKDAHYLNPFDETHQLGFWLLSADEQERLAVELLSSGVEVSESAGLRH